MSGLHTFLFGLHILVDSTRKLYPVILNPSKRAYLFMTGVQQGRWITCSTFHRLRGRSTQASRDCRPRPLSTTRLRRQRRLHHQEYLERLGTRVDRGNVPRTDCYLWNLETLKPSNLLQPLMLGQSDLLAVHWLSLYKHARIQRIAIVSPVLV